MDKSVVTNFDTVALLAFLRKAIDYGWPDHTVRRDEGEFAGFYETKYSDGAWRYHDMWCGATVDVGAQFVFHNDVLVWSCLYRGGLIDPTDANELSVDANPVFRFLVDALNSGRAEELPIRGPRVVQRERWTYQFVPRGNIRSFVAVETIENEQRTRYERVLVGGVCGDGVTYGPPMQVFR